MLKSYGIGGVAHEILVSAQGPLVLGLRVWGLGLTTIGEHIKFGWDST